MDVIGWLIGLVGIIFTILFGIGYFKIHNRPCKITFLKLDCINFYNNLISQFDNMQILHNKKGVDNNLVFMSGAFVCTGVKDINGSNKVILTLPEGCKWIDTKVVKHTDGLISRFSKSGTHPTKATLEFELFREKEFITCNALVEVDKNISPEKLIDKISFTHRIENTDDIEIGEYHKYKNKPYLLWIKGIAMLVLLIGIAVSCFYIDKGNKLMYMNTASNEMYSAYVDKDLNVNLRTNSLINTLFYRNDKVVSIDELERNYVPKAVFKPWNTERKLMMSMLFLEFILMAYLQISSIRRYYKFKKIDNAYRP